MGEHDIDGAKHAEEEQTTAVDSPQEQPPVLSHHPIAESNTGQQLGDLVQRQGREFEVTESDVEEDEGQGGQLRRPDRSVQWGTERLPWPGGPYVVGAGPQALSGREEEAGEEEEGGHTQVPPGQAFGECSAGN